MNGLMFLDACTSAKESLACTDIVPNGIPGSLAILIHYGYLAIQVAVPVILIIFGMIGLAKALVSQKEDEIKSAQSSFIKKLIIAVVIFLVFAIVHLVFNMASNGAKDSKSIWTCVEQLLNAECVESAE